jgi:hypothetical protein
MLLSRELLVMVILSNDLDKSLPGYQLPVQLSKPGLDVRKGGG